MAVGIPMTRLTFYQGKDTTIAFVVMDPITGEPEDLTPGGTVVKFYRKPSRQTDDSDPRVKSYTATGLTNVGNATVSIPGGDNVASGVTWWRLDVTKGGQTRTAELGPLEVFAV